ncbi:BMC domain-containing protein [Carboxydothermus ferrireducens]|uniref:Microcompartment protein CcmL/EutN n=1 Tax=Carboxydothermus ferrireducens DSM 11255 TaxID=1119529 RepID=A0ABX2REH5_9THEO|nr:BMC domain-containing protein [Carboxydothermus ferrireducens]NYE58481.1 microcompartment protein CcmL/EutN [Carboxydothermus ferrireducens DSM 11255]
MITAIGFAEFNSIAQGIETADAMVKAAQVDLLYCRSVCPGKYIVLISGDVAAVENSVKTAIEKSADSLVDYFVIPNVHPAVIKSFTSTSQDIDFQAIGVIETFSIAAAIIAADTCVKAAEIDLIEVRLGIGIGGKAFVTLTGDIGAVKAAIEAGSKEVKEKGLLVNKVVIPSPHKSLLPFLL